MKYKVKIVQLEWPQLWEMVLSGKTLKEAGAKWGITSERARQIFMHRSNPNRNIPKHEKGPRKLAYEKFLKRQQEIKRLYGRDTYSHRLTDLQKAQSQFFIRKRQNVLYKTLWDFTIVMSDLEWPLYCPALKIELDWFATTRCENSPSIDRFDNTKGYIPGNVRIISWRANRIKNDGTADEHLKIYRYMSQV